MGTLLDGNSQAGLLRPLGRIIQYAITCPSLLEIKTSAPAGRPSAFG
jgi:hypothetical protein